MKKFIFLSIILILTFLVYLTIIAGEVLSDLSRGFVAPVQTVQVMQEETTAEVSSESSQISSQPYSQS